METGLSILSLISIIVLAIVYFFLITEKLNKVIVAILGAALLVVMQVFKTVSHSSQENALEFISKNLDVLGFIIGIMILVGIVKESGLFEASAIWIVKKVGGKPKLLLVVIGYLTLLMTVFLSNIPTIVILTPVLLILIRQLKLPYLPYFFIMVTMANIGGAATPISDPTTYYQAKTVGLGFLEVVSNSGLIVVVLSVISSLYTLVVFNKQLSSIVSTAKDVSDFNPSLAIQNKTILYYGTPLLVLAIVLMIAKESIKSVTGIGLDNATITLGLAFVAMLAFHKTPKDVFKELIDWEIIFFFTGLFIVVGSLEFTHVIEKLAELLIHISDGSAVYLTLLVSVGSGVLSTFIDNVPYNITMVGAIQSMAQAGIYVYPLWWALNLGTSVGGAGSPIAAACNVIAFGQLEKEKIHNSFVKYLLLALPLVLINSLITFGIIYLKFLQ